MIPRRNLLVAGLLILAVVCCYGQVGSFDFVNYDDHRYITQNPHVQQGLTAQNIAWAFTTLDVANWHPLTWLSHMLDFELYGLGNPGGHHLTNVLLHLANALLLLTILNRMTGSFWRSSMVAALFTVHPLHVESVAWVSERKDVLSSFFGLLTILAYLRLVRAPSVGRYAIVACLFASSLLCKPMLVTLPILLLLLDVWPMRRTWIVANGTNGKQSTLPTLIAEKLPLLAMAVGSSIITIIAQHRGGAVRGLDAMALHDRVGNALVSYIAYIEQMFWPAKLAPFYPLQQAWPIANVLGAAAIILLISLLSLWQYRRRPHLMTGWLWYLILLLPVIGLIQVGSQAHADRYTYLPLVGLFIMLVWSVPELRTQTARLAAGSAAFVTVLALMCVTWVQTQHWHDSIALSRHTLQVTSRNAVAHFNLANGLVSRNGTGDLDEAIGHLQQAAQIMPAWTDVRNNLGNALLRRNRLEDAIKAYQSALELRPEFPEAWCNLGLAQLRLHHFDGAGAAFEQALRLRPDYGDAHVGYGNVFVAQNRWNDAVGHFNRAISIMPNDFRPHLGLATALMNLGRRDEAMSHLNAAATIARAAGQKELLNDILARIQSVPKQSPSTQP